MKKQNESEYNIFTSHIDWQVYKMTKNSFQKKTRFMSRLMAY